MGSGQSFCNTIPQDVAKSCDAQLQQLIHSAILCDPWYPRTELEDLYGRHCALYRQRRQGADEKFWSSTDYVLLLNKHCLSIEEFALRITIREAYNVGYRPITPDEYRSFLQQQHKSKRDKVKLWVADLRFREDSPRTARSHDSCSTSSQVHVPLHELPCSKEDILREYEKVLHSSGTKSGLDVAHYNSADDAAVLEMSYEPVDTQCDTEEWPCISTSNRN
jgi:hypothetical protein